MLSITVVIPTFNRAGLLQRAIASVLAQTYSDFNVVVVDDCSTDDTEIAVTRFCDARLRYVRRAQRGSAAATRNTGIRAADGDLICFLDDDDEYLPGFLERMASAFAACGSNVGFGWCGVQLVRRDGSNGVQISESHWQPKASGREQTYVAILGARQVGTNCGFTIRRDVVQRVGYFDEALLRCEDNDYLIRLAREFDFVAVPEVLVRVHLHAGPRMTKFDAQMAEAQERVFAKHYAEIRRYPGLLARYHYKLGWVHYHAGDSRRGRSHLRSALARHPLDLKAWAALALFTAFGSRAVAAHVALSQARKELRRG